MRTSPAFLIATVATLTLGCDKNWSDWGCGGHTCPFPDPTHRAVVQGTVLGLSEQPLAGIRTNVTFEGQVYSGVGTITDAAGRFRATAHVDLARDSTIDALVWAVQANPPPAAIVRDSLRVRLHFKPRAEPPVTLEVTMHLPVAP